MPDPLQQQGWTTARTGMEPAAASLMRNDEGRDLTSSAADIDPRVPLALERTFLAWIRTGLAMMGFGFVVARFGLFLRELERARGGAVPAGPGVSPILGTMLVALGICAAGWAALRLRRGLAAAAAGESPLGRSATVPTLIAVALCGIGVAAICYFLLTS